MNARKVATSRLGRHALAYAERGLHVFPLAPRGKLPLIKGGGGFTAATASLDHVNAWWGTQPDANVGLWPGPSGLCVVDLDGPDGVETARALGLLAEPTLECRTGREDGGRHLYFKRPDFTVTNAAIGKKVDVRCDAGYVILPPSVHPSGRLYAWLGKFDDVRELPADALDAIRRAQSAGPGAFGPASTSQGAARDIVFEESIDEGGRNNALTRYAGRLLAKGIPEAEVLVLVSSVNVAKCRPPLPPNEINVMVAGLAQREARKRMTSSGTTLTLLERDAEPESDIPAFSALAAEQVAAAKAALDRDSSNDPRWMWTDVDKLAGPMIPGNLVVVGSLMGNGKSTFLMSQMDAFATSRRPVLYAPLEIDPDACRNQWAAWRLGLDMIAAARGHWHMLPRGAKDRVKAVLDEQLVDPFIHFASPKRMTMAALYAWCRRARDEVGVGIVMLDHLHRMDFGADAMSHRIVVTEIARRLKDMARELRIVLIAAAQLNRSSDPVDRYVPPGLSRLKESAGIAEEADVVLMLSRRLKKEKPAKWQLMLRTGEIAEHQLADDGVMQVTCRKHRLDGSAVDHSAALSIVNGRAVNKAPEWRYPLSSPSRYEPDRGEAHEPEHVSDHDMEFPA